MKKEVEDEEIISPKLTEREKLEQEKVKLAKELGIWQKFEPVEGYQEADQFKRINEIDTRLQELVK